MSVVAIPTEPTERQLYDVLDLIRHREGLSTVAAVLIDAGVGSNTAYRRIKKPTDLRFDELQAVADRFGVPLRIITGSRADMLRWMLENPGPSDDGPGVPAEYPPWDSNPEPAD